MLITNSRLPMRALAAAVIFPICALVPTVVHARALEVVDIQAQGDGGVQGLAGVLDVAVSPDGAHVYAVGPSDNALAAFRRDPATGGLNLFEVERDGVAGVDGLAGASALALSRDGAHVYVTGMLDDALAVFRRDPKTGSLTFLEAHKQDVLGVDGLTYARAVVVSPDGMQVYVGGQRDNAIAVFRRNPMLGTLAFAGMYKDGIGGEGLAGVLGLALSPDGAHLYAAGGSASAIAVFRRDAATGALSFVQAYADGPDSMGLHGIHSVVVSPDGKNVYAAGQADDAVAVFRRDPGSGALTLVEVQAEGIDGVDGIYGALWVAVSPDGTHVYVTGTLDNALAVFRRDARTGVLGFVEAHNVASGLNYLAFARAVAASADGRSVYAGGASSNALVAFRVTGE